MLRILLTLAIFLVSLPALAVEFEKDDFTANVYGEFYGDFFYSGVLGDEPEHAFGSSAFLGSSLFGVELAYKDISATFELGLSDVIRKYFITYNIGGSDDHFLLVGREDNLAFYSFGQVSDDLASLNDFGTIADNRRMQLRYGVAGFQLAVLLPSMADGAVDWMDTEDPGYIGELGYVDVNSQEYSISDKFAIIPRVELAYGLENDNMDFIVFASYGAYLYDYNESDLTLHSFHVGLGGTNNFGDAFLSYTAWYGMNMDLTGSIGTFSHIEVLDEETGEFSVADENIHSFGVALGFGYTIADSITPQIGLGYTANLGDFYNNGELDDRLGVYLNCEFAVNDWLAFTPEIAYRTSGLATGNMENEILAGLLTTVAF